MMLLQLAYELCAGCTSVVKVSGWVRYTPCYVHSRLYCLSGCAAQDSPNGPILARNLDWPMPLLRDLLINVVFVKGGHVVFTSTTFVGYVGCLTGSKPRAFAVSVNFRATVDMDGGFRQLAPVFGQSIMAAARGAWPVSMLVRRCLEEDTDFAQAVGSLSHSKLIAPTYITVAGCLHGQGVCITRDRAAPVARRNQWLEHGDVVQCNMDAWDRDADKDEAMGESLLRRELARQLLRAIPPAQVGFPTLRRVLEAYPIGNEVTIHYAIMCPATAQHESGHSVWFDDHMQLPTRCCHVAVQQSVLGTSTARKPGGRRRRCAKPVPPSVDAVVDIAARSDLPGSLGVRFVRACRRGCSSAPAKGGGSACGFDRHYCRAHDPLNYDALLQDADAGSQSACAAAASSRCLDKASRGSHGDAQIKPSKKRLRPGTAVETDSAGANARPRVRQRKAVIGDDG